MSLTAKLQNVTWCTVCVRCRLCFCPCLARQQQQHHQQQHQQQQQQQQLQLQGGDGDGGGRARRAHGVIVIVGDPLRPGDRQGPQRSGTAVPCRSLGNLTSVRKYG